MRENWKKTMEHENDGDTDSNWRARNSHQSIGKETGRIGNKKMSGDHTNYSIVKLDKNTEKSPVDLSRLAVARTPEKDRQPRPV